MVGLTLPALAPERSISPVPDRSSFPSIKEIASRRSKGEPPPVSVRIRDALPRQSRRDHLSPVRVRTHASATHPGKQKRNFGGGVPSLPRIPGADTLPELVTPRSIADSPRRKSPVHSPRIGSLPDVFDPAVRARPRETAPGVP